MADYAVQFPGTPANYYHGVNSLSHDPYGNLTLGYGGCVAWVRIDSAGYATIYTSISNFSRCFNESVPPADLNEWDYTSIVQTYLWFGVINGHLTFEAQDGRIAAKSYTGGTVGYSTAGARDAAVASFRATYASLPHNDGVTVPIPTFETSSFGITVYFATLPGGINGPQGSAGHEHTDLSQKVTVTGPALTPGVWYRVGYRWVTPSVSGLGPPFVSSTIELWIDCALVTTGAWSVTNMNFGHGYSQTTNLGFNGSLDDLFIGGDPTTDLHRGGATVTPITITDLKIWKDRTLVNGIMDAECACGPGATPNIWWKMTSTADLTDSGNLVGGPIPPMPVGSVVNDSTDPVNPCNSGPPPPPPPPPPETGTVVVIKQVVPATDTTTFQFTAMVPPPTPVVFFLQHGQSRTFTGVPVGSGYSVIEVLNPLYTKNYVVSNGGSNTAFSVAAGEVVTITVQNVRIPTPPSPTITSLTFDCLTAVLTSTGQNFTSGMSIVVTKNGIRITDFSIVSQTTNRLVLQLHSASSGVNQLCVTVSDGIAPSTICTSVDCGGCPSVLDDRTNQILTTVDGIPIVTTDGETIEVSAI